jgi:ketosteroid isomerase-like protein
MKSMRLIASVMVAVCLLVAPLAWSQGGNVEQQIKTLQDQVVQAYLKADTGFMEKYFADGYTAIHGDGRLYTKAQEIENYKSGALKYESIDLRERKIRAYGDMAVDIVLASAKGTYGGKSFNADFRATHIWVKRKGNWKIVAFQTTRVAPPS